MVEDAQKQIYALPLLRRTLGDVWRINVYDGPPCPGTQDLVWKRLKDLGRR